MFVNVESEFTGMLMQQSTPVKKEKESIKDVPDGTRKKSVTG